MVPESLHRAYVNWHLTEPRQVKGAVLEHSLVNAVATFKRGCEKWLAKPTEKNTRSAVNSAKSLANFLDGYGDHAIPFVLDSWLLNLTARDVVSYLHDVCDSIPCLSCIHFPELLSFLPDFFREMLDCFVRSANGLSPFDTPYFDERVPGLDVVD